MLSWIEFWYGLPRRTSFSLPSPYRASTESACARIWRAIRAAALEAVEIHIQRRPLIDHAGVGVEIEQRRSEQSANVDRSLRETRREVDVEIDRRAAHGRPHAPAPIDVGAIRQGHLAVGRDGKRFGRAGKIEQRGHQMRAGFEDDVSRIAQHPVIERAKADLAQLIEMIEGDVIDRPERFRMHGLAQALERRRKQEVVADAEIEAAFRCEPDQFVRFRGRGAHRLFQEDVNAGLQRCLGQRKMQIGRRQDVDAIDLVFPRSIFDRDSKASGIFQAPAKAFARPRLASHVAASSTPAASRMDRA